MKIEILASYKVLICYDATFFIHDLEKEWTSIDGILNRIKADMELYGFWTAAVTDATTGELLITVKYEEDF